MQRDKVMADAQYEGRELLRQPRLVHECLQAGVFLPVPTKVVFLLRAIGVLSG